METLADGREGIASAEHGELKPTEQVFAAWLCSPRSA
jgi:hypothetical protein